MEDMKSRKVLTVNQVVDILLRWVETRDWEDALYAVVPKRKFQTCDKSKEPSEVAMQDGGGGDDDDKSNYQENDDQAGDTETRLE